VIPKRLHLIWLGGPRPAVYDHDARWSELHPGWDVRLWGDADLDGWDVSGLLGEAGRFAPADDQVRWKVDILRLQVLAVHGGIYVDCDTVPHRSFEPLLSDGPWLAETPNVPGTPTNAVMGMPAGHPLMVDMVGQVAARVEAYAGRRVVKQVGGGWLTELVGGYPDVRLLPWWWFASRPIRRRRRPDPRNMTEGFCDHMYANTL
jgi:mannosyltransferase OCH1-like enzyme